MDSQVLEDICRMRYEEGKTLEEIKKKHHYSTTYISMVLQNDKRYKKRVRIEKKKRMRRTDHEDIYKNLSVQMDRAKMVFELIHVGNKLEITEYIEKQIRLDNGKFQKVVITEKTSGEVIQKSEHCIFVRTKSGIETIPKSYLICQQYELRKVG